MESFQSPGDMYAGAGALEIVRKFSVLKLFMFLQGREVDVMKDRFFMSVLMSQIFTEKI
jgi:hypothetical protein